MTARDRELYDRFVEQVKTIMATESIHPSSLAHLAGLGYRTAGNFFTGNAISLKSALRMADTLGYEVVFVKRTARENEEQNPDVVVKVHGYKEVIKSKKYSRYKIKTPEEHGKERKRASYKEDPESWFARYSRRKSVDRANNDDDFLGPDGRGDEIP
jgi:hypothetical protein